MTTIAAPIYTRSGEPPQFLFYEVSWEYYDHTLRELDRARQRARVTYDDGSMEIMTVGDEREHAKTTIGRLIELYATEMNIPITGLGSITCRRKRLRKGLEPDECYYVTTPAPPLTRKPLNLNKYPPPDLAIEIDITRGSIPRQPIYAALGVPEVWRFDGTRLTFLHRQPDGTYRGAERSTAFPDLPLHELNRCMAISVKENQHAAVTAFRDWLRSR